MLRLAGLRPREKRKRKHIEDYEEWELDHARSLHRFIFVFGNVMMVGMAIACTLGGYWYVGLMILITMSMAGNVRESKLCLQFLEREDQRRLEEWEEDHPRPSRPNEWTTPPIIRGNWPRLTPYQRGRGWLDMWKSAEPTSHDMETNYWQKRQTTLPHDEDE